MSGFFARKGLLRTKKELRKSKKDEEEGKIVFVVLFFLGFKQKILNARKENPGWRLAESDPIVLLGQDSTPARELS